MTTTQGTAVVTLPSDTEILITRDFLAPRELVYRAWTTPELVRRWWYANRGEVISIEIDLRVGGRWRYVMRANGGFEVAFHGEFHEIVPNERLVSTEVYEAAPEAEALNRTSFTESNGITTVELLVQHQKREWRNAQLDSGMEDGLQDALDLLEQAAQSLAL
ncbi:MAG: SRPBCC family protein [Actinobacteria bacterium]|nr:SRPBCC family protein [Actinomycetota bacterium]